MAGPRYRRLPGAGRGPRWTFSHRPEGGGRAEGFPASTGVGGRNPMGAALAAAAWAVRLHDPAAKVMHFAPSPEQCPASSYGSAFSRAVEIGSAGFRRLLVSGTASIASDGKTEHIGDAQAQIERSMQVMEAILEWRRMTL